MLCLKSRSILIAQSLFFNNHEFILKKNSERHSYLMSATFLNDAVQSNCMIQYILTMINPQRESSFACKLIANNCELTQFFQ
jgi:hypothetical protein